MTETDSEKINIRLHIYDSEISVRVPRAEEAFYRKGAVLINDLLNAYHNSYKNVKTDKEITYFVMIDLALRLEKLMDKNDTKPYDDLLEKLTSEIVDVLGQKKHCE